MYGAIDRRQWLAQCASLAFAALLPLPARAASDGSDTVIGGGRFQESPQGEIKFVLAKAQSPGRAIATAQSNFFPHGFAVHPRQPQLVAAFEKIGDGAGLFDVRGMRLLQVIAPRPGRQFYGHGAWSADAKLVYSTETVVASGSGAIGVRDGASFEYLGDFPTYGDNPHDCHLIENGSVLAVTNGGGTAASGRRASLCYIDVATQKLLEKREMRDERFNTGHVQVLAKRAAIVVSAPRKGLGTESLGAVSMRRAGGRLEVLQNPVAQQMFGEALSVAAVPEAKLFVVTHPTPGMLTCWDLGSARLRAVLPLARARGVALSQDRQTLLVSFGPQASLGRIDVATLALLPESVFTNTFITGSHLLNWQPA